jgi:DNA-binding response OmpR family regulator
MNVLIVESNPDLGLLWKSHVERLGACLVVLADGLDEAIQEIMRHEWNVIVLNLVLHDGGAMAVSDYASYRQPKARLLIVNSSSFFTDGSIFNHMANAHASFPSSTRPEDLAAMVQHYGQVEA